MGNNGENCHARAPRSGDPTDPGNMHVMLRKITCEQLRTGERGNGYCRECNSSDGNIHNPSQD